VSVHVSHQDRIADLVRKHPKVRENPSRKTMIEETVTHREAMVAKGGGLATWTAPDSTGRSPKDTITVRRPGSEANIDWDAPNNIPIPPETFDALFDDALALLAKKEALYVTDRVIGADPSYALPVKTVTPKALTALFTENMFRPVPQEIAKSRFASKGFTMLVLPDDKLDPQKYQGKLRVDPNLGHTSTMVVAMDMDRRLGVIIGSNYCGSVKKMMFTVMNYMLPLEGILSLHCSANEGPAGDTALLLGLSGTGKTTLSADPARALLGDDEHGWSDTGIANYEYGCYAKLIDLSPKKEPEIYRACFGGGEWRENGAIIENLMVYPDGTYDVHDSRLTPNSRGSFLLTALTNVKSSGTGGHPKTILFLTADANGVLPPVAKLTREQAMLWFLMGYTSKLAGTETGVTTPQTTFSRFFGAPFMPLKPDYYTSLLGKKMDQHGTDVFLVNTGWSGGPAGEGKRMDIDLTRAMVQAALSGKLRDVGYEEDKLFHVMIPKSCPGVPPEILTPRNTWKDTTKYDAWARKLAAEFSAQFDKAYGGKVAKEIESQCPGK
jgi:phosphoenolpyruvate carboxykinase (ATP)